MREWAYEVEVADYGPGPWAWWQLVLLAAEVAADEEEDGYGCEPYGCVWKASQFHRYNGCLGGDIL